MAKIDRLVLLRVERDQEELPGHPRHNSPPLDLKYIQEGLLDVLGYRPAVIDGWLEGWSTGRLIEEVLKHRPDAAVIKAATPAIDEALAVAAALKRAGVITIAVGQQVAHVHHKPLPGWAEAYDVPVPGDPEEEVPALLRRLRGGLPLDEAALPYARALQRGREFLVMDPDRLPRPHFERAELALYDWPFPVPGRRRRRWGYVLAGWGCPHRCEHCSGVVRVTCGARLRARRPDSLLDEIASLLQTGAQAIIFEDDTLLSDRRGFLDLCDRIARRKMRFRWMSHARADHLDEERVSAAAQAGAMFLKVGVESGAPHVIEAIGKAPDGSTWVPCVERGFELLHRHGIGAVALFLLGSPQETREDVEKSIELAIRIRADYVQVQIFCAYPDSPYYAQLPPEVRSRVDSAGQYHYAHQTWTASRMVPEELLELQARFYRRFYLRPAYIFRHLLRFWRFYTSPRSAMNCAFRMAAWVAGLRAKAR